MDKAYMAAVGMLCPETAMILGRLPASEQANIREIRLRRNKPVALTDGSETLFIREDGVIVYTPERAAVCTGKQLSDTFHRLCGYSVYSKQNEIINGYITVKGGHRIGICGTAELKDGKISSVTDISSMNIRIARFIEGVSERLIKEVNVFDGLLIAGAPSTGKTTMLRDIAYRVSMGIGCKRLRVCVVDERGELSGCRDDGEADIGMCDIMLNYPKGEGMIRAIRSLSPQVIIADEAGTKEDAAAIAMCANAGVSMIATIHASDIGGLVRRPQARLLLDTGAFSKIVMLDSVDKPCSYTVHSVEDVYFMTPLNDEIFELMNKEQK